MKKEVNKFVFKYKRNETGVTITKVTDARGDVVIPFGIDDLPVTSIGDWAFAGCSRLTGMTIPDSVTHIGGAFEDCTKLMSVPCGKQKFLQHEAFRLANVRDGQSSICQKTVCNGDVQKTTMTENSKRKD